MSRFSKEFLTWLDTNADHIDQESGPIADQLLEKIAENEVFKIGVPAEFEGLDGKPTQVIDVLNELAQRFFDSFLYFLGTPYFHRVYPS